MTVADRVTPAPGAHPPMPDEWSAHEVVVGDETDVLALHRSRIEELERRVADLEQTNRHLAAVAADVAHDLRSPLQAISGFTELLVRREGARLDETSQSFLAHVLGATHGMRELIEAVLDHRRSSSAMLDVSRFDCTEVVNAAIRRIGQDLDVCVQVGVGTLPFVCADQIQLGRVFQNLVSNAIRCTPQGHEPPRVTARRRADAWEFTVTDHGIGVHDDDRLRIFEPFERGPQAATDGAGYGMGLAICRSIVERHGGRIGVAATSRGGSRFSFTLPDSLPQAAIRATGVGSFPTA